MWTNQKRIGSNHKNNVTKSVIKENPQTNSMKIIQSYVSGKNKKHRWYVMSDSDYRKNGGRILRNFVADE